MANVARTLGTSFFVFLLPDFHFMLRKNCIDVKILKFFSLTRLKKRNTEMAAGDKDLNHHPKCVHVCQCHTKLVLHILKKTTVSHPVIKCAPRGF